MKHIIIRGYEITCNDIYCLDVDCKFCPLRIYAENNGNKDDFMRTRSVTIPEKDMPEFVSKFDRIVSMMLAVNPEKKVEK